MKQKAVLWLGLAILCLLTPVRSSWTLWELEPEHQSIFVNRPLQISRGVGPVTSSAPQSSVSSPSPLRIALHPSVTSHVDLVETAATPNLAYPTPGSGPILASRLAFPLRFEPNRGQVGSETQFVGHSGNYAIHFKQTSAELQIPHASTEFPATRARERQIQSVGIEFVGASQQAHLEPAQKMVGQSSYFIGSNEEQWITDLPTYAQLQYQQIYPGIDLIFYGSQGQLEYDFIVSPKGNANNIALRFSREADARLDAAGHLELLTNGTQLRFLKPIVYQLDEKQNRTPVEASYRLLADGDGEVLKFDVGAYDPNKSLIIDPVLVYGKPINISGTVATLNIDAVGNIYVASNTSYSTVTKFASDGQTVLYTANLGSSYSGDITSLAVDSNGQAVIGGYFGAGFPTTANAYRGDVASGTHALLAVLNPAGNGLAYSSYFPSSNTDYGQRVAVDQQNKLYLAGQTYGNDFPVTTGVQFTGYNDAFVLKVDPTRNGDASLIYSTLIPPTSTATAVGLAVDASFNVYLAINANSLQPTAGAFDYNGQYASSGGTYVAKLDASGAVTYISYLGYGDASDLALDGSGNVYVTGSPSYGDYPATSGSYQTTYPYGFVTKLNPAGSALVFSTFLSGPSGKVDPQSISLPVGCVSNCAIYVTGGTTATDFPTTNALQSTNAGGSDAFLVQLRADGSGVSLSTYLGGSSTDDVSGGNLFHIPAVALDGSGNIYVTGNTYSSDFPFTQSATSGTYGFLMKISPNAGASLVPDIFAYNFGSQIINVAETSPVTLRNYGSSPLTISNIVVNGDFSQTNDCGGTIAPGGNCSLQMIFTPSFVGNRFGSISVTHNGVNSPTTIALRGNGYDQAYLTLSPSHLDFGAQPVNTTSAALSFTVTNSGSQPAPIYGFSISNPTYSQTNNCPASLATGASCTVAVSFSPLSGEQQLGYIYISASAGFSGNSYVSLSGIGSGVGTGAVVVSPSDAIFADQVLGTTSPYRYLSLYNVGTVPVQVASPTVTGDFLLNSSNCGPTLNPGQSCYAYVAFRPTALGTRSGTLTFVDTVGSQVVNLSGNALAPSAGLTASPTDMVFNDQVVGTTSSYQQVLVVNTGNTPVSISRVFLNGLDFNIQYSSCFTTLSPLGTCYLSVRFSPTATGSRSDNLTIVNSTGTSLLINLAGTGLAPEQSVYTTPQTYTFNDTIVGTQSTYAYFEIYNPGNTPVTISSIQSDSAEFLVSQNYCTSISAQSYCQIYARFVPTSVGQKTATITITDSAPNNPHTIGVSGHATLATQAVVPAPGTLNFGDQVVGTTSGAQTISFYNPGNTNVKVSNVATSGDFKLSYNGCSTIYADSYCSVNVTFTPSLDGQRTGTLTVYDDAPGNPHTVQLFGNGLTRDSVVIASPPAIAFLDTAVGDASTAQTVYFYNTGNLPVKVSSTTISGDFSFSYNGCTGTIPVASYCYVNVQFKPSAPGSRTGTITMMDDATGGQHGASLSGNALVANKSLGFTSTSLNFGDVQNNTTSTAQGLWVVNSGTQSVHITQVVASTGFNASGCITTLAPNGSCFISVTFSPTSIGLINGSLTLTDDALGSPQTIGLQGNSLASTPTTTVTPPGSVFAPRLVGTTSSANSINFNNRSGISLTISSVTVNGDFAIVNNNCSTVANNSGCGVTVTTTPTAAGTRSGTLTFSYATGQTAINLSGYGISPVKTAVVSPSTLAFTNQVVSTSSGVQTAYLYNTGTAPLNLGAPSITGDFSIQSNGCGATLAAGSSCYVQAKFTPSGVGQRTGQLTINDDSGTGPHVLSLSGTGIAATKSLTVSTSLVNFPDQPAGTTSGYQYVYLNNEGTVAIQLGTFSFTGDFASDYRSCGATLSSGSSCYVRLTFTPTDTGLREGTLLLNNDSSSGPQTVLLTGNGVPATKILVISEPALQYPDQPVGTSSTTQAVYLYNQGSLPIKFTSAYSITGDFAVTFTYCTGTLQPQSYCYYNIQFKPTQAGTRNGTLTVNDDATGNPQTITLLGNGVNVTRTTRVSAQALVFGSQAIGTTSSSQYIYLYNLGNVPLNLTGTAVTGDFSSPTNYCTPGVIAAGSYCFTYVVFTPTTSGTRTGTLTFTHDGTTSPQVVTLSGLGLDPQAKISISTSSLAFGNQEVNAATAAQSATITNLSNVPITFTGVTSDNPEFTLSNSCSTLTYYGQTCNFSVSFKPSATGLRTGNVRIVSNASGSPMSVSVSGTGVAGGQGAQLSQTSISFSDQGVGTTSGGVAIYYVNYGSTAVTTSKATISPDFVQDGGCDQTSIGHNGYCVVKIAFKPSTTGVLRGTYSLPDNTTSSPRVITLSGNGVPLAPAVTTFPLALTFNSQLVGTTSPGQQVTVYNTGNAALTISGIAANPAGEFFISNGCGTVQANSSCSFSVSFKPSAGGSRTASLQITDNASGSPQQVPVTGTGVSSAAIASISPTSIDFGVVAAGATSSARSVTLYNTGNAVLSISNIAASGNFQIQSGGTCTASLNPNSNCSVNLLFSPTTTGLLTGTLTFTDNDVSGQQVVSLYGSGIPPTGIQLDPSSIIFGNQIVNTTSGAQTITVQSTGASLNISGITATGDFSQTNNCPASAPLSYNQTCSINVKFNPTQVGIRNGSVTVSDTVQGSHVISLSGTATGSAAVQLSPTNLTFPSTNQGTSSTAQSITLTNTGAGSLSLSGISATGDFAQTNNCGVNVNAGANCTINVTFSPTTFGARTGTLTISDNSADSPQTVSLTGTGIAAHAVAVPTSLTFAAQVVNTTSTAQQIQIQNDGNSTLTVTSISITGQEFGQTNNCSNVIPAATCTINVTFTPLAAGARSGTMSVNSSGGNLSLGLSGSGTGPVATLDKTSLPFGSVNVNTSSPTQTVKLTSSGDTALTITGIAISGDYSQTNDCPASLAVNSSCTIVVTFTPTAVGARNGTLTISNNAANSPQLVSLTGSGFGSAVQFSPASLDFGNVLVNTTSTSQPIAITNSGASNLIISGISTSGDFAQTNNCPATLTPSSSCTANVTFKPTGLGTRSGSLNVTSNAGSQSAALSGIGITQDLSFMPTSLNFGNYPVGLRSQPQNVIVTDSGNLPITISSITASSDYVQTNNCPSTLQPAAICTIMVSFAPTQQASIPGSITIISDAPSSPQMISLSGTGTPPQADLKLSGSANPPRIPQGAQVTFNISLTNNGPSAATGTLLNLNAPLNGTVNSVTTTVGSCSGTASITCSLGNLAAGSSAMVSVNVTNTTIGPMTVTAAASAMEMDSNSADNVLSLTSTSAAADLRIIPAITPTTLNGTPAYTMALANDGPSVASNAVMSCMLDRFGYNASIASQGSCAYNGLAVSCALGDMPNGGNAAVTLALVPPSSGWASIECTAISDLYDPNPRNNAAQLSPSPSGFNTTMGNNVAVTIADPQTGAAADVVFTTVSRPGATSLSIASAPASAPFGYRASPATVVYSVNTTAEFSGPLTLILHYPPSNYKHPEKVRLFQAENGTWLDRTTAVNSQTGAAAGVAFTLSQFALFEPANHLPIANPGQSTLTPALATSGTVVTLDGSASTDVDGDTLTYRWTGPFLEGNGLVTGVRPNITLPIGNSQVTLVTSDGEVDSAPATITVTVSDFEVSASGAVLLPAHTSSATATITIVPKWGGFDRTVTLGCSNLPAGVTCQFSPATITPGSGGGSASLTITRSVSASVKYHQTPERLWPFAVLLPFGIVQVKSTWGQRRSSIKRLLLIAMVLLLLYSAGCGGGAQSSLFTPQPSTTGTSSTIVVTATSGSVQHGANLSLTMQ